MDIKEYMDIALNSIKELETGKKFITKDLFKGIKWDSLSKGDRIAFGKFFANEVRENKIPQVKAIVSGKNTKFIKICE